jgi:D-alanine-D-alanine ligase
MQRMRVAVLRGGPSEEYEVSLKTGASVLRALDPKRYEVVDVVIGKDGEWLLRGIRRDPRDIFHLVDVVFVALHGAYGEDGTVQRLMDSTGVKYTGSRAFPSAIALNKPMTKDRMLTHGVKMARHMVIGRDVKDNLPGAVMAITELFGPRYIVKPLSSGSSVGTMFAESPIMLEQALRTALEVYDQVLVEEFIEGREATCGVVEKFRDKSHYALPPIEIRRQSEVWGYEAKYDGSVEEICPGNFSRAEKDEIERLALLAHETLGLSHYSRSDFIVAPDGIYFLEVNTLPGLTETSLLPKALEAVGCAYADFVEHLIKLAHTHR